jgi:hypothetical protein
MPTGNSKKRRSTTDFKTVKRKLGKKYKSSTHTDLSFQTRSIFMPTQSVSEEKDEYVNARNLSLPDLLSQCRHYNESTRRDAVNDLKDFLLKFPIILEKHLSGICDKLVELMLDSSGDVRMALYSLLDEVLPLVPESLVYPFFPLFVAYISTGMTHVNGAVRLDALQYSNLWLHYHPGLVAKFHSKLLPHYLTLMTMRDPPPKVEKADKIRRLPKEKKGPTEAKLHIPNALKMKNVLLASLYDLVVAQLGHAELFGSQDDLDLHSARMASKHLHLGALDHDEASAAWPRSAAVVVPFQPSYSLSSLLEANTHLAHFSGTKIESTKRQNEDMTPTESKLHLEDPECFKYFFITVFPLLTSQWLECNPDTLVPHALKPLESILKLFDFLLSHLSSLIGNDPESQSAKFEFLEPYLKPVVNFIFPHFPFDYPPNWTDDELSLVTHLNVLIAMVGSHFYSPDTLEDNWAHSVLEYTHKAFTGSISRPAGRRASKQASQDFSPKFNDSMHYQIVGELLPVIGRLTAHSPATERVRLLKAFQAFNDTSPPQSSSKRMCIAFLASVLLRNGDMDDSSSSQVENNSMDVDDPSSSSSSSSKANENHSGEELDQADMPIPFQPQNSSGSIPPEVCESLLLSLPKALWMLKAEQPVTSHMILGILAHFGATNAPVQKSQFARLQPALIPFFWTSIAKKAKKGKANKQKQGDEDEPAQKTVFGPFVSLPAHVQRAAVDMLSNFMPFTENMYESLLHAFSSPKVSVEVIGYLFDSISAPDAHFSAASDFASFALSFLISVASEALKNDENCTHRLQRCFLVARMVARACTRLGAGNDFLLLIDEHLTQILQSLPSSATEVDDEFILVATMSAFIGAFLRHLPQPEIPADLFAPLSTAFLNILTSSTVPNEKVRFRPGLLMVKDAILAEPLLLQRLFEMVAVELSQRPVSPSSATLVLALVTKFKSRATIEIIRTSTALPTILSALKKALPNNPVVDSAEAERSLILQLD